MITWKIHNRGKRFEVIVHNSDGRVQSCGLTDPGITLPDVEDWLCHQLANGDRVEYPGGQVFAALYRHVMQA